MAREDDRADAARRRIKRAGGLLRDAAGDLAALERDRLAELDLDSATDLPRAEELLELMLARYGRVRLTVQRAPQPHHGAPQGRGGTT